MLEAPPDDPRVSVRRPGPPDPDGKAVVYWMQRAQRADDNPALDAAIAAANELRIPVVVLFVVDPHFPGANLRHFQFMLDGLIELPDELSARGAGFVLRVGARDEVARFCGDVRAALLVGDENPLREPERWRRQVADALRVPFWTVDADMVVPSALLEKEQWSAGTMRPRVLRHLDLCLRPSARPKARIAWRAPRSLARVLPGVGLLDELPVGRALAPVPGWRGGRRAGLARLRRFIRQGLDGYSKMRNRPETDGTSRLSPYLHFGQLGPREIAVATRAAGAPLEDRQAFIEELVVRRELAVNFVRYNAAYDRVESAARWARETLDRHRADPRRWVYSERQLEQAETHDPLWNAAQRQMVESGWMHGYLRMYWAKKILEWSASPEAAMAAAIAMNDRYQLDGRDPNGYAGIAWAVAGKHDRAWGPERPIYGTVRYMSLASTSRKFDSRAYMARWSDCPPPRIHETRKRSLCRASGSSPRV
jgi:deoxyribodipyrimidine photo-lyase